MTSLKTKPQVAYRSLGELSDRSLALRGARRGDESYARAVVFAREVREAYMKRPAAERYREYYEGIIKGWAPLSKARQSHVERLIGTLKENPGFESRIAAWKELNAIWVERTGTLSAEQKREFLVRLEACSTEEDAKRIFMSLHVIHTQALKDYRGFSMTALYGVEGLEFYSDVENDTSEDGMFLAWFVQYQAALRQNALSGLKRGPNGKGQMKARFAGKRA
ncbi:MAG: hypothetical protein KGH69_05040 [Candidatus Micrarchaeota archaeon]|nr:hypothetical protein [Candidatus Micrarchaeota archaeon]